MERKAQDIILEQCFACKKVRRATVMRQGRFRCHNREHQIKYAWTRMKLANTGHVPLDSVVHHQARCSSVEKLFGLVKECLKKTLSTCVNVEGEWKNENVLDKMEIQPPSRNDVADRKVGTPLGNALG